jgi:hypothetical protein
MNAATRGDECRFHDMNGVAISPANAETRRVSMKMLLALAGAAVVMSAAPAEARHHARHAAMVCAKYRHHHCVAYRTASMRHLARYRTGYVFGPRYGYTAYDALPHTYVTRYHLSPNYRYVYSGNTIYVVDPTSYAITRIINGIVR